MPDPLTQTTQDFAPAVGGANMFDPTVGRDVIARYGVAGMRRDDMAKNLRLSGLARQDRLGAMQEQETVAGAPLRARGREVAATKLDLEEQDLLDRKEARGMEGDFLSELWGIRRGDPEYRTKVEDAMASIPPALRKNPAVETWWDYSENNLRDMDMRERTELSDSLIQGRADDRAITSAVAAAGGSITPERLAELRQKYPDPDDYMHAAVAEGSGKKREAAIDDRKTVDDNRQENWMERIRASKTASQKAAGIKDFEEKTLMQMETRPNAYPSPVDNLRIEVAANYLDGEPTGTKADIDAAVKNLRGGLKELDSKIGPDTLGEAKALEENLPALASEWALKFPEDMEGYVDLVPDLSERDKEARRDVWRLANEAWDAPAPASEPANPNTKEVGGVTYIFDGKGWLPSP